MSPHRRHLDEDGAAAQRHRPSEGRRGAALVEFALVAPLLFSVLFLFIEFDRYLCVIHATEEAARIGCRTAILGTATKAAVESDVKGILDPFGIKKYTVTITPALDSGLELGDPVTVAVNMQYSDVSWLPTPTYLGAKTISIKSTLPKEK